MSIEYNNNTMRKKNPIKRNNMFFSKEDFNFLSEIGRECVEDVINQTVVLYQVDLQKTQVNDIYHEARKDNIRFKTPVELPVIFTLDGAELNAYDKKGQKGLYSKIGKLTFGVYIKTLEELECDIKRGDYIGLQVTEEHMEYFSVSDDGRIDSYANKNTLFGTAPIVRNITCAPVDINEFNG